MPSNKSNFTKPEKFNSEPSTNSSLPFEIDTIEFFEKQAKRLIKKYPSLIKEIQELKQKLRLNPQMGTPLRNSCYEIRLAITSKGKGISGGARIITHTVVVNNIVYLLAIYDKSEQATITTNRYANLLN